MAWEACLGPGFYLLDFPHVLVKVSQLQDAREKRHPSWGAGRRSRPDLKRSCQGSVDTLWEFPGEGRTLAFEARSESQWPPREEEWDLGPEWPRA